jgi:4-hydroxybenzoate polyprenyltransferase
MMRAKWVLAWFNERFPLRNGLFFVLLYLTTVLVARGSVESATVALTPNDVFGAAALWSFFLLLRVFDEHKDFAADAIAHPERVLQRGLVTLPQLRLVGAGAAALQLLVSLWFDRGIGVTTAWWLAALAWSVLMAREFFAPAWLRRHLLIYAVSHMAVMPLLVGWVATMGTPDATHRPILWGLSTLVFLAGFVFEVARKIRSPEDERPAADSYTRALGVGGASALLAVLATVTYAVAVVLAGRFAPTNSVTALLTGALSLVAIVAALWFALRPTRRGAKVAEAAAGLAIMAAHVMVVLAVASVREVVWR